MESALLLALSVVIAILVLALNFEVQVATIQQGQPNLRRRICQVSGTSLGFGVLFLVIGMLVQFKLFTWATPTTWMSAGSILIISVAIPLLVQGYRLGKTGDGLKKFARELHTSSRVLRIIAVVLLVITIIIPFAIPGISWLLNVFK